MQDIAVLHVFGSLPWPYLGGSYGSDTPVYVRLRRSKENKQSLGAGGGEPRHCSVYALGFVPGYAR
jgi:hypothetical protein